MGPCGAQVLLLGVYGDAVRALPRPVQFACGRMMFVDRYTPFDALHASLLRSVAMPAFRTVGSDPVRVFVVGSWRALGMWALTGAGAGRRRKVVLVGFVCFLERGSATQFIFAIVFSWVSRSLREETSVEAMSFTSCKRGLWFIAKPLNLYPPPPFDGNMGWS